MCYRQGRSEGKTKQHLQESINDFIFKNKATKTTMKNNSNILPNMHILDVPQPVVKKQTDYLKHSRSDL